jgi:copper chaperone
MSELTSGTPLPLINSGSTCACCAPAESSAGVRGEASGTTGAGTTDAGTTPVTTLLQVAGMTCGHCVAAVTEELSAIEGVSAVDVDLVPGGASAVSVTSAADLNPDAVEAAVEEAGYALVPSTR